MKIGDLVKYKRCGTLGIITKAREARFNKIVKIMYEILWSDGVISDVLPRDLEAICK